jgi:hypothetical protein
MTYDRYLESNAFCAINRDCAAKCDMVCLGIPPMSAVVKEQKPIPIIANLDAPDIFSDGAYGAFITNGNVHITLVTRRSDHGNPSGHLTDVVIGRLIMPIGAAEKMVKFVGDCLEATKLPLSISPDMQRTLQ